jgi:hypothetical protein
MEIIEKNDIELLQKLSYIFEFKSVVLILNYEYIEHNIDDSNKIKKRKLNKKRKTKQKKETS